MLSFRKSAIRTKAALLSACLSILFAALFLLPSPYNTAFPGNVYAAEHAEEVSPPLSAEPKGKEAVSTAPLPAFQGAPKLTAGDYPQVKWINGRILVWMAAQIHLWFAAFVLAVPIFVFVIELIGMFTHDERYDRMAYEFIKVSLSAYSVTAVVGGLLAFSLFIFYPDFFKYMASIFSPSMLAYAFLFFAESASLYIYYYGWHAMRHGFLKWAHLSIGLILNAAGTALMFLANAWVSFMMSPHGVDAAGVPDGNIWHAIHNHLWNPMNLHRTVANIAYGGSIVGAYAAYKFLTSRTDEEKAHYDWMGYTANFLAVGALLPLPFAGYWLVAEIYSYSQQMGITLMGGTFAWLFITQAVLIGSLFLSANYYLWCGMERSPGAERYTKYIKYIAGVILLCFLIWFTPHTLILKPWELKALGGQYHPYLGPLGIMPAKNTAVNIMLIFTFLSFLLYRRANKVAVVSWAGPGSAVQAALIAAAILNIIGLGAYYGYFTNTVYKVASSVPQVASTLFAMVSCMVIDVLMFRGATEVGPFKWGKMPERSQYALFLLAVSFTWLMGLMGFIRSGIRQHWHVYTVLRDNSPDAFTPSIGYAAKVVSVAAVIFMAMVIFIFWLSQLSSKKQEGH